VGTRSRQIAWGGGWIVSPLLARIPCSITLVSWVFWARCQHMDQAIIKPCLHTLGNPFTDRPLRSADARTQLYNHRAFQLYRKFLNRSRRNFVQFVVDNDALPFAGAILNPDLVGGRSHRCPQHNHPVNPQWLADQHFIKPIARQQIGIPEAASLSLAPGSLTVEQVEDSRFAGSAFPTERSGATSGLTFHKKPDRDLGIDWR
jgi:hypothetical protein